MNDKTNIDNDSLDSEDQNNEENELEPFMNCIVVDTDIDEDASPRKINALELTDKIGKALEDTIGKIKYPVVPAAQLAVSNMASLLDSSAYTAAMQVTSLATKDSLCNAFNSANDIMNNNCAAYFDQISSAAQAGFMSSALYDLGNAINSMPIYQNIDYSRMLDPLRDVMDRISKTYFDIFHSIDLGKLLLDKMTALVDAPFQFMDIYEEREKFSETYLNTLVECYWFPYISDSLSLGYINEILDIRLHTRSINSRKKQIDSFIFSVFTKSTLREIKSRWYHTIEDKTRSRMLRQCIDAHVDGKYALSVCTLAPIWEAIIKDKKNHEGFAAPKKIKSYLFELVEEDEYPHAKIIKDYYEQFTILSYNNGEELKEDTPSRNPIAHGYFPTYPSRKMSLNAILFTDFLLNL